MNTEKETKKEIATAELKSMQKRDKKADKKLKQWDIKQILVIYHQQYKNNLCGQKIELNELLLSV